MNDNKSWYQKLLQRLGLSGRGEALSDDAVARETRKTIRLGAWVFWLGLGAFLLWACFAPLDSGVPGNGVVIVGSKRKTIQHLHGGIVQEIAVHEGDLVPAGAVLVRLNDTDVKAQHDIVQQQYAQMLAMQSRLQAERDKAKQITFPVELQEMGEQVPQIAETMRAQTSLFEARRSALMGEFKTMDSMIQGLQSNIRGLNSIQGGKSAQLSALNKELAAYRELAAEGFAPRSKVHDLERAVADVSGTRGNDAAQVARMQAGISELQLKKLQRELDQNKEVGLQLAEVQKEVAVQHDRYKSALEAYERATIRSPIEGHVVGLNVATIGGVIRSGEHIMDIVPQGDKLVIEAQFPVNLINTVKVGSLVTVNFQILLGGGKSPAIEGKLVQLSADRMTDPRTGFPYYQGRIEITPKGEEELRANNIVPQPGMQAAVIVRTGERTLMQYLIDPLVTRLSTGLREQ